MKTAKELQRLAAAEEPASRLIVRLSALAANYREALRRASPAVIAPVVKADAYGLGMIPSARVFAVAGADSFFVARLSEAIQLRAALPRARIFVLDGLAPGTAPVFVAHRLTPVLNTLEEIAEWSVHAKAERTVLDAVLQIDTGMNRCGLSGADAAQLAANPAQHLSGLGLALVMSHLACADEPSHKMNAIQLQRFRAALAMLPAAPASLVASPGIELGRDYLFDVVRPGIALYGGNPILEPGFANPYRVAARLTAPVLQIRRIEKGETTGYGATFTAAGPTVLAIVAGGYADGVMRSLTKKGQVAIGGVRVPFAGRISMDLVTLDVTGISNSTLYRGAEVELMGDVVTLDDHAAAAGTVNHEILTAISPRAERVYVEG